MKTNIFKKYMDSNYRTERNFATDNQRATSSHKNRIRRALKKKARNEFNRDMSL